jgi:hypothetical protein
MYETPMTEVAQDRAKSVTSGCQPVFMAWTTYARSAFDNALPFQLAKTGHKHCPGNQRNAAMDVIE